MMLLLVLFGDSRERERHTVTTDCEPKNVVSAGVAVAIARSLSLPVRRSHKHGANSPKL